MLSPLDPSQPSYGYRPLDLAEPVVSIITAYHNAGPVLLEAAQTVLRQSLQQWEWIVVNDGSDDPLGLRALLPLRSADSRVRVIDRQQREGLASALNAGVALSRARLLFFLDAESQLDPTALETLAWSLAGRPSSAFAGAWRTVDGRRPSRPQGFDARHAFLYENTASAQSMVRREVFEQLGGFDTARPPALARYEFWLRCAARGLWGHDLRETLIWSRGALDDQADARLQHDFLREMRGRYPRLFSDGLPSSEPPRTSLFSAHAIVPAELPFENCLLPAGRRQVLLLLPWIRIGGADTFALDLVAGLVARGDRVSVCLTRAMEHTWLDELRRLTCDVFNLASFLVPGDYPRFLHYLINSRQITTVLISNSLLGYQLLPYLRSRCPQIAYVDFLHAEEEHFRNGGFPRAGVDHDGLLDMHITSSQHLRQWMVDHGATPERSEVCTTNIDPARWWSTPEERARVRASLGIRADMPLILFAGRLVPQKRPRLAVEVLRRLHAQGGRFTALIAGSGEDYAWLRYYVRWNGLAEPVRFLGAVSHERIRELLAASDLLLLPSDYEGIALILFEALSMGVVPVAADVGGQRELVTPECGVLIPHVEDELARYVEALQRLIADSGLRTRMAAAGRARIQEGFRLDQMLDRMQLLLDQAEARALRDPRPPVSSGAGHASAALAIEHYQLEDSLRKLPLGRPLLALRQSYAWRLLGRLRGLRGYADAAMRRLYAARRLRMPD